MKNQSFMLVVGVALLAGLVNGLTFKGRHEAADSLESLIVSRFTHRLSHYAEIPPSVLTAMKDLVKNDPEMLQSVKQNKPLSDAGAQKVKNFLINNKDFQNFSISVLTAKAEKPDCLKDISGELKVKILKLILNEWDFKGIFQDKKEDLKDPQVKDVVTKLEKEKDIKAELDRCFAKYE